MVHDVTWSAGDGSAAPSVRVYADPTNDPAGPVSVSTGGRSATATTPASLAVPPSLSVPVTVTVYAPSSPGVNRTAAPSPCATVCPPGAATDQCSVTVSPAPGSVGAATVKLTSCPS